MVLDLGTLRPVEAGTRPSPSEPTPEDPRLRDQRDPLPTRASKDPRTSESSPTPAPSHVLIACGTDGEGLDSRLDYPRPTVDVPE